MKKKIQDICKNTSVIDKYMSSSSVQTVQVIASNDGTSHTLTYSNPENLVPIVTKQTIGKLFNDFFASCEMSPNDTSFKVKYVTHYGLLCLFNNMKSFLAKHIAHAVTNIPHDTEVIAIFYNDTSEEYNNAIVFDQALDDNAFLQIDIIQKLYANFYDDILQLVNKKVHMVRYSSVGCV